MISYPLRRILVGLFLIMVAIFVIAMKEKYAEMAVTQKIFKDAFTIRLLKVIWAPIAFMLILIGLLLIASAFLWE